MKRLAGCPFYDGCSPGGCFGTNGPDGDFELESRPYCIQGDFENCPLYLEAVLRRPGQTFGRGDVRQARMEK
jgi:hypothetical protein